MEIGTVYPRAIFAIAAIAAIVMYVGDTTAMTQILAAIVAIVYLDQDVSGEEEENV